MAIKGRFYESRYRWFSTKCKSTISLKKKKGTTGIATKGNKPAEKLWNSTVLTHGTKLNQHQLGGEGKKRKRKETAKDQQKCFLCKTKKGENPQQKNKQTPNCRQLVMCDTANLPIIQLASKHRARHRRY